MALPRHIILSLLSIAVFIYKANGLICFWCDNEKSFDMCTRMGSLRFCQPNENSCHTEVLRFQRPQGVVFSISKRCKQDDACQNNQIQNPKAAWQPSQCNPRFPNSVCRCCCKGDLCNRGGLYCPLGPLCAKIPEITQNGYTKCDLGRNRYSLCNHECQDGFTLFGPETTECVPRGSLRWSNNTVPKCLRTTCVYEKVQIRHGTTICTDRNNLGSQCEFDCAPGYALQLGWPITTCAASAPGEDPQWDGEIPVCSKITCKDVIERDNGVIECSNGTRIDSSCRLKCDRIKGYFPVGVKAIKCGIRYNRLPPRWSDEFGECQKIVCPGLSILKYGEIKCSAETRYTSQCRYVCKKGYRRVGPSGRRCSKYDKGGNGIWDTTAPITCQPQLCVPDISAPAKGEKKCTNENRFGSKCSFECATGFFLKGSPTSTCLHPQKKGSKAWSHPVPRCIAITCSSIPRNPNRNMKCTNGVLHGSKCSFKCAKGYSIEGATSITCFGDGTTREGEWDDTAPSCVQDSCPLLTRPEHGSKTCTNGRTYGSRCVFECDEGYVLNGPKSSECHAIKKSPPTWSSSMPSCDMIVCRSQPPPDNSKRDCTNGAKYGSTCSYKCDSGYTLSGSQTRSCDDLDGDGVGKWTNPQPVCNVIVCGAPKLPEVLKMKCTDGANYGSKCQFSCTGDYEIQGPTSRKCADLDGDGIGKWTDILPTCTKIPCSPVKKVVNGKVKCTDGSKIKSKCAYECLPGHKLTGNDQRFCLDNDDDGDGEWSNPPPTCEEIVCRTQKVPDNMKMKCTDGNQYGSRCSYECEEGYKLSGANKRSCDDLDGDGVGKWTAPLPSCDIIVCFVPKLPGVLKMTCTDGANYGSRCQFSCSGDYELQGPTSRKCDDLKGDGVGKWTDIIPTCAKVPCSPSKNIANGKVKCTDGSNIRSECTYECLPGYKLTGAEQRTCHDKDGDGDGEWSSPPPACEEIVCRVQAIPDNMNVKCTDGARFGSRCSYECDEGYNLSGAKTRACADLDGDGVGKWTTPLPSCNIVVCFVPKLPAVLKMTCTDGSNYGSKCSFTCSGQFELSGPKSRKCADEDGDGVGKWTDILPTCNKIPCPPLKDVANGEVECTDGSNLRSSCTYKCDPGYTMSGSQNTFCLDSDSDGDGEWRAPPPTCKVVVCTKQTMPDNMSLECTNGIRVGSTCTYKCAKGYNLSGSMKRSCADRDGDGAGNWTAPLPSCRVIVCRVPRLSQRLKMDCTEGSKYGSKCTFSCSGKYQLSGPASRQCADPNGDGIGQWTDGLPFCKKTPCTPYKQLENGVISCTDGSNVRSVCSYRCNPGYKMSGFFRRVCLDPDDDGLGEWTVDPPTCELIYCPKLVHSEKLTKACSRGREYSSKCSFVCPDDQVLYPFYAQSIDCQANGTWSNDPPCCFEYCPPKAVMDMVIILDSSSSITAANWIKVIDFVKSVISVFTISKNYAQFGFFRYNKYVDTRNEVLLKDFSSKEQFVEALEDLPYDGEGTYTGRALDHALRVSFRPDNGNRPDVSDIILLITDGVSTGVDDIIDESIQKLRRTNVEVIALFIEPVMSSFTNKAMKQLSAITGNPRHIIKPKAGFDSLNEVLAPVSEVACKRQCQGKDVILTSKEEFELLVESGAYYRS